MTGLLNSLDSKTHPYHGRNFIGKNDIFYKVENQSGASAATSAAASAALQFLVEHVVENVGLDISGSYSDCHYAFL